MGIGSIILGAVEIVGGLAIDYVTAGTAGNQLIAAGVATTVSGIISELSGPPANGHATTTRNSIKAWECLYGEARSGGALIYQNTWGSNNQVCDMVIALAAHSCDSVPVLLIDGKRVQIDTTAIPTTAKAGYSIPSPAAGSGTSFTPVQQNIQPSDIRRDSHGVVTVTLAQNIPYLQAGDQVIIQSITGDLTLNGKWTVAEIISQTFGSPGSIQFTYLSGGNPSIVNNEGGCLTTWPDYKRNIYFEPMLGNQSLGSSFIGMLAGTPWMGTGKLVTPASPLNAGGTATPNPWTNYCSCVGHTVVFLRLIYDPVVMPTIPQISFIVKGNNNVFDTRTSSYGWTDNAALCCADFLANQTFGFKCVYGTDIDTTALSAAANVCDQNVPLVIGGTEKRYTCNGKFDLTQNRGEILSNLLTSCAGRLTYQAGNYAINPGAWTATLEYDFTSRVNVNSYNGLATWDTYGPVAGGYEAIETWPGSCNVVNWGAMIGFQVTGVPSCVQSTGNASTFLSGGYSTWTVAYSSANTAGNALIVDVCFDTNYPIEGVTVSDSQGNTYACVFGAHTSGSASYVASFIATDCVAGSNTVTITAVGSHSPQAICTAIHEYSNVSLALPTGGYSGAPFGYYTDVTGCCDFVVSNTGPMDNTITLSGSATTSDLIHVIGASLPYCAGLTLASASPVTGIDLMAIAAGPFKYASTSTGRERYNGCKGTYIAIDSRYQSGDFPAYCQDWNHGYGSGPGDDILLDADNDERRWLELHLPFTVTASTAQRLAKIALLKSRFGGSGSFTLDMSGYKYEPLDIIPADVSFLSWSGKTIEVQAARLKIEDGQDSGPVLSTEIDIRETDSSIYTWSTEEELSPYNFVQSNYPRGYYIPGNPLPWSPGYVAPLVGDALFPNGTTGLASFGVQPVYSVDAQGNSVINLNIKGTPPITALDYKVAAPQFFATANTSGGSLADGQYVVGLSAYDAGSNWTNTDYLDIAIVTISGGGGSGSISLTINQGSGDDGGEIYAGYWNDTGDYVYHLNQTFSSSATSATITAIDESQHGGPDPVVATLGIVPTAIIHGGPWAAVINSLTSTTLTFGCNGMTTNQWAGYNCTLLAKGDPTIEVPIINLAVASSTASSGGLFTLTIGANSLGHSPANLTTLLNVGDVILMRSNPTFADSSFTDVNIANGFYPTGATGVEAGHLAVMLNGVNAGDVRTISSVTTDGFGNYTVFNISAPWSTTPNTGDLVIITAPTSLPQYQTGQLTAKNATGGSVIVASPNVSNLAGSSWLMRVRTLDAQGQYGSDTVAPYRELFIFGGGVTRYVYANTTQLVNDGNLLVDTTSGNVTVQLLPVATLQNQSLLIKKISSDSHTVTILPYSGETLDGLGSVVLVNLNDLLELKATIG